MGGEGRLLLTGDSRPGAQLGCRELWEASLTSRSARHAPCTGMIPGPCPSAPWPGLSSSGQCPVPGDHCGSGGHVVFARRPCSPITGLTSGCSHRRQ